MLCDISVLQKTVAYNYVNSSNIFNQHKNTNRLLIGNQKIFDIHIGYPLFSTEIEFSSNAVYNTQIMLIKRMKNVVGCTCYTEKRYIEIFHLFYPTEITSSTAQYKHQSYFRVNKNCKKCNKIKKCNKKYFFKGLFKKIKYI